MKLIPFKTWLIAEGQRIGVGYMGAYLRFRQGKIPSPPIYRKNSRVILVEIDETMKPAPKMNFEKPTRKPARTCDCGNPSNIRKSGYDVCDRCDRIERMLLHQENRQCGGMFRETPNPKAENE